ncbi:hypothetical protein BJ875DRAFT_162601 [Amylocarpus encephaloides]|uniref:Uncharacterized protein n=1 Tax=Amylocarpus encephaloides TaxID=45428 RepID=A0A9P7YAR2_9HELO|nr:hypothetical protein BJ875DRAFT_162601 [Amylocarpus encephaloides]
MFSQLILFASLSALFALASANFTQVINNHTFISSGPDLTASLETYQLSTHKTAVRLLKTRLGEDGLLALLQPDIKEADAFWHTVIENSTPDVWHAASARVVCFFPTLTAYDFFRWTASPLADAANLEANAEHYMKRTVTLPTGGLQSQILEGWGGVTTLFNIPDYAFPPNRTKYPFLDDHSLAAGWFSAAGAKNLLDGSNATFGVLQTSVRDVDGSAYGQAGKKGIEVVANVFMGDGAKNDFVEAERQHMVIEIIALTSQAQKDYESGLITHVDP